MAAAGSIEADPIPHRKHITEAAVAPLTLTLTLTLTAGQLATVVGRAAAVLSIMIMTDAPHLTIIKIIIGVRTPSIVPVMVARIRPFTRQQLNRDDCFVPETAGAALDSLVSTWTMTTERKRS